MDRRTFLTALGSAGLAAGAAAWLAYRTQREPLPEVPSATGPTLGPDGVPLAPDGRPVFPERYRETLRALTLCLVPDEPDAPGAGETQAYAYVEREMARPDMKGARRTLMRGASQLDTVGRQVIGKPFAGATAEEQNRVVMAMLEGTGSKAKFDAGQFIRVMMALTLEGMFSDPLHGGNKEMRGWLLVGYAMHPPRPGDDFCVQTEGGIECAPPEDPSRD